VGWPRLVAFRVGVRGVDMLKGVEVWLRLNMVIEFVEFVILNVAFDVFAVVRRESYASEMIMMVYLSARLCECEDLGWKSS
jgi:hypothetical protein